MGEVNITFCLVVGCHKRFRGVWTNKDAEPGLKIARLTKRVGSLLTSCGCVLKAPAQSESVLFSMKKKEKREKHPSAPKIRAIVPQRI